MSNEYIPQEHAFVTFCSDINKPHTAFEGPCAILHMTNRYVWVSATYADTLHPDMRKVGCGEDDGYDYEGNCVVAVPIAFIKSYHTQEEAENIIACIEECYRLRSYAIG